MAERNKVAIFKCKNVVATVDEIFETLKPEFGKREVCIIKPNLCTLKKAITGATTHPELVGALVNRLRDFYKEVLIVESSSSGIDAEMKFKFCGYEKIAKETGAKLVNLTKTDSCRVEFEYAKFSIDLPKILFDCDTIVSVPTLKTHCLTTFTANLKNEYGFIPFPHKTAFHGKVNEVVANLHMIVRSKPTFCVVDGIVGMEGNGPNKGTPVGFDTLIAGIDPLIVDTVCCWAIGINPYTVKYLRLAAMYENRKIADIDDVGIVGDRLDTIKRDFKPAPREQPFSSWLKDSIVGLRPVNYVLDLTLIPILKYSRRKRVWKANLQ